MGWHDHRGYVPKKSDEEQKQNQQPNKQFVSLRRFGRAADSTRLLSEQGLTPFVGSNPTASATFY